MILLTLLTTATFAFADIKDYTREHYVLIKNEDALVYKEYGDILHVTNLTYYRELLIEEKTFFGQEKSKHSYTQSEFLDIDMEIQLVETLLIQLDNRRIRRGINELGTVWKWITGTPDHDDFTYITNKINDLITNNNKQFATNSELFETVKRLSTAVNTLTGHAYEKIVRRHRLRVVITDLQNTIQTIVLAKASILNPTILHYSEIQDILQHEYKNIHTTDLLDASTFKIVQKDFLIFIYIKYPLIHDKCDLYESKSIAQSDGKLEIPKQIIKCNTTYVNVKECKIELSNIYCKITEKENCLVNILNKKHAECRKLKEKNKPIDIIKEGAILISGNHTVENITLFGTYLITFNETIKIDNVTFENPTGKIYLYLENHNYYDFKILEYLETGNEYLKFENRNFMYEIQNEYSQNPVIHNIFIVSMLIFISYITYKLFIHFKMLRERKLAKNQEKIFTQLNKNIANLMTRDDSS